MKKKNSRKQHRIFAESIKKQTVRDIEKGLCSVREASEELGSSEQTIYNWLDRYSRYLKKNKVLVVEHKSEAYRSRELAKQIKELEAALGRKQMELDLLNKIIGLADEEYRTDLKKNFSQKLLNGSGSTKGSNTVIK